MKKEQTRALTELSKTKFIEMADFENALIEKLKADKTDNKVQQHMDEMAKKFGYTKYRLYQIICIEIYQDKINLDRFKRAILYSNNAIVKEQYTS